MTPLFALVDCNNFYVSCERVFAPHLEGRPVVVLSNNDGCIVSRSAEAKSLGVPMGAPFFRWESFLRLHKTAVFSSNYALYGDLSRRVMNTLSTFSPEIEIYSIDEAFLGLRLRPGVDLSVYGREIRERVRRWTGIPVSVGMASTKTLAKAANKLAKGDRGLGGVLNLADYPGADDLLAGLEVGSVWGIGPRYAAFLGRRGVHTALDLKRCAPDWARKHLTVCGQRTVLELRGQSCIPLDEAPDPKQGIRCSRTFGGTVTSLADLREAVATYTGRAAEKLRRQHSVAGLLHVYLMTNPFHVDRAQYANSWSRALPAATAYTPELVRVALIGLDEIYRPGYEYKRTGVVLLDIVSQDTVQLDLFEGDTDFQRRRRLMQTVDKINDCWGAHTLTFAGMGLRKPWKMQQQRLSPRFTTHWRELLTVR